MKIAFILIIWERGIISQSFYFNYNVISSLFDVRSQNEDVSMKWHKYRARKWRTPEWESLDGDGIMNDNL